MRTPKWLGFSTSFRPLLGLLMMTLALAVAWIRFSDGHLLRSHRAAASYGPMTGMKLVAAESRLPADVTFDHSAKQLLLIYSSGCGASQAAREPWKQLVSQLSDDIRVYGLSIDDPTDVPPGTAFFTDSRIEEWFADPVSLIRVVPARALPVTVVLGPQGRIELAESGVPTTRGVRVLARLLNGESRPRLNQ